LKICIPSLGRPDSIGKTLDFVGRENTRVYVNPDDEQAYIDSIGKELVRVVDDPKVRGITPTRQFMLEDNRKEDWFCMIDDDCIGMLYRFTDKFTEITETNHFREVLLSTYQMCLDLGTPLWSYSAPQNPSFYTLLDHFKFSGNMSSFHGIIPSLMGNINYDTRLKVMEDYDIALQCKYYKRFLIVDKRYCLKFNNPYFQKGGCSVNRNKDILWEAGELMRKKYGTKVVQRNPQKLQHKITFPF